MNHVGWRRWWWCQAHPHHLPYPTPNRIRIPHPLPRLQAQGKDVVPIPGTKSPARLVENAGALAVAAGLSAGDLAEIASAVGSAAGDRYEGMWGTFNLREGATAAAAGAAGAAASVDAKSL